MTIICMVLKTVAQRWLWWLALLVLGAFALQNERLHRAQAEAFRLALVADTLAAARDTSKELHLALGVLADSLHIVERRALQVAQARDALDRQLHVRRIARDSVVVRERVLDRSVTSIAPQVLRDSARRAAFDIRSPPYTVHAEVIVPGKTSEDSATMKLRVVLDSIPMEVRLSCGERVLAGVRPAVVTVSGPQWAQLHLARVEQEAELCAVNVAPQDSKSSLAFLLERVSAFAGYGIARRGVMPMLGVGVRLWP